MCSIQFSVLVKFKSYSHGMRNKFCIFKDD